MHVIDLAVRRPIERIRPCVFFNSDAARRRTSVGAHDRHEWTGIGDDLAVVRRPRLRPTADAQRDGRADRDIDRKSTRLNSSHITISYAVLCRKKKKGSGL